MTWVWFPVDLWGSREEEKKEGGEEKEKHEGVE